MTNRLKGSFAKRNKVQTAQVFTLRITRDVNQGLLCSQNSFKTSNTSLFFKDRMFLSLRENISYFIKNPKSTVMYIKDDMLIYNEI